MSNSGDAETTPKWIAKLLRFTAFLSDSIEPPSLQSWWSKVSNLPKSDQLVRQQGQFHEIGQIGEETLALQWQAGRVDWLLINSNESQSGEVTAWKDSIEKFSSIADQYLKLAECPSSIRIAVGCVVEVPVSNRKAGYEIIKELVKGYVKLDVEGSSDFIYQINRKRKSQVKDGLGINRVAKWLVPVEIPMSVQLPILPFGNIKSLSATEGKPRFAARQEFDINTAQENTELLNPELQKNLVKELLGFVEEMILHGDIV
ncbi:MAG: hypothetical protein M5U26_25830 [Planctomycetota bacterium]|nr:hypothetical protein [Planctomycetota bacterium]